MPVETDKYAKQETLNVYELNELKFNYSRLLNKKLHLIYDVQAAKKQNWEIPQSASSATIERISRDRSLSPEKQVDLLFKDLFLLLKVNQDSKILNEQEKNEYSKLIVEHFNLASLTINGTTEEMHHVLEKMAHRNDRETFLPKFFKDLYNKHYMDKPQLLKDISFLNLMDEWSGKNSLLKEIFNNVLNSSPLDEIPLQKVFDLAKEISDVKTKDKVMYDFFLRIQREFFPTSNKDNDSLLNMSIQIEQQIVDKLFYRERFANQPEHWIAQSEPLYIIQSNLIDLERWSEALDLALKIKHPLGKQSALTNLIDNEECPTSIKKLTLHYIDNPNPILGKNPIETLIWNEIEKSADKAKTCIDVLDIMQPERPLTTYMHEKILRDPFYETLNTRNLMHILVTCQRETISLDKVIEVAYQAINKQYAQAAIHERALDVDGRRLTSDEIYQEYIERNYKLISANQENLRLLSFLYQSSLDQSDPYLAMKAADLMFLDDIYSHRKRYWAYKSISKSLSFWHRWPFSDLESRLKKGMQEARDLNDNSPISHHYKVDPKSLHLEWSLSTKWGG